MFRLCKNTTVFYGNFKYFYGVQILTGLSSMPSCQNVPSLPLAKFGQGNVFTGVCLSTGGSYDVTTCYGQPPTPDSTLWTAPPSEQHHPTLRQHHTHLDSTTLLSVNKWAVRILLECFLFINAHFGYKIKFLQLLPSGKSHCWFGIWHELFRKWQRSLQYLIRETKIWY